MDTVSTSIPQELRVAGVYKAINRVHKKIAALGIPKENQNHEQKYDYRSIDDVYNALSPMLAEEGLIVIPKTNSHAIKEATTKAGSVKYHAVVSMDYEFVCIEDGSIRVIGPMFGEAMDMSDKSSSKAASMAYKYALMQLFSIPTQGDNDADANTPPETAANRNGQSQQNNKPAEKTSEQIRDLMIADINSDLFASKRDQLGEDIKKGSKKLNEADHKAVQEAWAARHDSFVDKDKSRKLGDVITSMLTLATTEKEIADAEKMIANNKDKLTIADIKTLKSFVAEEREKLKNAGAGNQHNNKPADNKQAGNHGTPFDADSEVPRSQWTPNSRA